MDLNLSSTLSPRPPLGLRTFFKKRFFLAIHELTLGLEFESYLHPLPSGLRKYFKKIFFGQFMITL